jgi:hypothetical protein
MWLRFAPLLLCGWRFGGAVPVEDQWQLIAPSSTGAVDDIGLGKHHHVYIPSEAKRSSDAIVVFLPGTTWPASYYEQFLHTSADLGLVTIGLAYDWSNRSITEVNYNADLNDKLWGDIHEAVVNGGKWPEAKWKTDAPTQDVSTQNSVVYRLHALLHYCGLSSALLSDGNINWNQIVIAGHSQGGVHAWFMAKIFSVQALLSFSGEGEHNAAWVSPEFATPWEKLRLVTHSKDELGIQVSLTNVRKMNFDAKRSCQSAGEAVPSSCSFIVLTEAVTPRRLDKLHPYHESTALDEQTPLQGAVPQLLPLWQSLLQQSSESKKRRSSVVV